MNYGYLDEENLPQLKDEDEDNRLSIQLYHHLVKEIDIKGKRVLEIGCGRGGGSRYLHSYYNPGELVGIDYCQRAITFCNSINTLPKLKFYQGDAENLSFHDESFDVVINVESSHCYGSFRKFLSHVKRVLNKDGYFLITDFRENYHIKSLIEDIKDSGLRLIRHDDISKKVIDALEHGHDSRIETITNRVPVLLRNLFREYAGVKNTNIYRKFKSSRVKYMSFILQKA